MSRKLSMTARFEILTEMKKVLTKSGDHWVYAADYSDATIATKFGASRRAVVAMRREVFGNIPTNPRGGGLLANATKRIDTLERRVAELEDAITRSLKGEQDRRLAGSAPQILKSFADIAPAMAGAKK